MAISPQQTESENFPVEVDLRDGSRVLIRPVTPDDKHLIEVGLEHLSKESRYLRFFHPVSKLSRKLLTEFTEIDHIDHEAIGALGTGSNSDMPFGVARYIRAPHHPTVAEIAVTVIDGQQGKGLGTLLLAFLACRAVSNGVTEFCAYVLGGNHRMLEVFKELGSTTETGPAGEVEPRQQVVLFQSCRTGCIAGRHGGSPVGSGDKYRARYFLCLSARVADFR